jgi:hypothetical protein
MLAVFPDVLTGEQRHGLTEERLRIATTRTYRCLFEM